MSSPVNLYKDFLRSKNEIIYSGNTWSQYKLEILESKNYALKRFGNKGVTEIYFKTGEILVINFVSFKVMMTLGIKQLGIDIWR